VAKRIKRLSYAAFAPKPSLFSLLVFEYFRRRPNVFILVKTANKRRVYVTNLQQAAAALHSSRRWEALQLRNDNIQVNERQ
jgi:PHD/YefM family antitoxin component YafN of YafNO toxin-antitoxin module